MEHLLTHMSHASTLDEQKQVNIYTNGLLEPLKTDVEFQNPHDMEMAKSLTRAYERRAAIVADSNKATTTMDRQHDHPFHQGTTTNS